MTEPTPILGTKLHPPRRRRALVARPRLAGPAAGAHPAKLTLVSAPAGFGKTTLVADWFGDGASTAWVALDARDDDPGRFWTYVAAALATVVPDLEDLVESLRVPQPPVDGVVDHLLNALAEHGSDVVLVLDDLHVVQSPEVHDALALLLEHLPPQVHVVVATRADPPLPLASMRARGDLREVRAADLRFTAAEAAAYLNDAMDLALTAADVEVLEARTEGWIAALQLAALSLQGRADPAAFVAEFAGDDRFILDYLADEVLERQPPEVRDFLLDTSVLGSFTAELCAAVTGQPDARATLDRLDRANLFLVPLDDRRTWYRYHHLFADVLRARLRADHPDRVAGLHRRASEWHAAHGDGHEAVEHAMAGGDPAWAAELIERLAPELQRARREATLRRWLEALPAELFADRPVLAMDLVGARMATGDASDVDALLEVVDRWLGAGPDADPRPVVHDRAAYDRLPAMAAIHRAGRSLLAGDLDATIAHAESVAHLAVFDELHRGAAAALLGLATWARGDLATAHDRYVESIECFVRGGYHPDVLGCTLALTDILLTLGRLGEADRAFERALRLATEGATLRGAADIHVGLAQVAVERGDLDAAAAHLDASDHLGPGLGLPQHAYRSRVAAASLARARGDLDAAIELLEDAERRYDTDYSPPVRPVAAMVAAARVEAGGIAAGRRWAAEAGVSPGDELTYVREFELLTLARLLVAESEDGDREAAATAIDLLDRLLVAADGGGRSGTAIEVLVLLARAHRAAGDDARAKAFRTQAEDRARPEGYRRVLLDGLDARARHDERGPDPSRRPTGPDELSDRELDVLRLLRSDLSGPDIARELHVSLNTLRTHTKHIYTKLGATNRREAVRRAAELGI
ncbi:MAG: helix-turn-helix transcriptional regulator [Actinobacteria bacterium]|nr:helix-turn-helix transcriptional regulator [Actinomycetota bacterium]